jgi:PAS domain S-box-containing protein
MQPRPSDSTDADAATLQRESERLLAGVLDSSLDGIAALQAVRDAAGQIVDFSWLIVNRRAEQLLGRTAAELVGRTLLDTLPGNRDLGLFDVYVRVVETGTPAESEFYYEADAISGWFQNIAARFGDGFTVTFRDITRQKEAEETRLALAAARMGTWELDLDTGAITGSNGAAEIFGLDPGEGHRFEDYLAQIHPDDRPRVEAILSATRAGAAHSVEFRVGRPGATPRWVISRGAVMADQAGRPRRISGVLTDITERHQAEERAERLLAVTAALAGAPTVAAAVAVILDHAVAALGASAALVGLLAPGGQQLAIVDHRGYRPDLDPPAQVPLSTRWPVVDTAIGQGPLFLSPPEIVARYPALAPVPAVLAGSCACLPLTAGERILGAMLLNFSDDRAFSAAERTFLSSLAGQCAQAIERAALFETERASRAAAEEALQHRDQFLSAAAHELRTPLTVLLGNADLLARRAARASDGDGRDARAARAIAGQVARLDRLINLILDVTSLQADQLAIEPLPVNLAPLAAQVVATLQPTVPHHTIALDARAPVWVFGDPLRLARVMEELLDNGVRYSPAGGTVTLRLWAEGGQARIRVRDEGIGIPAESLPRVFERFYRAPNVDVNGGMSGLGLGLAIVHAIVELHDGTITVSSAPGAGSTALISLPLLAADTGAGRAVIPERTTVDANHPGR